MKSLAMGAVLWDIIEKQEYMGGAPFNLTAHLAQLGWDAALLSCVGKDDRGRRAKTEMRKLGVNDRFIYEHAALPTGIAKVALDGKGSPSYELPHSAYDEIPWSETNIEQLWNFAPDILCFGTHEQRSVHNRKLLKSLIRSVKVKYIYYDVNLRLGFVPKDIIAELIDDSNILKLNDQEVECLSEALWDCSASPESFCKRIASEHELYCAVVTLGKEGCLLWYKGKATRIPGYAVKVKNTVGCGDAFSAGFLTALFKTGDPVRAADRGNYLGAYVAASEQAIPQYSGTMFHHIEEAEKNCIV